MNLWPHNLEENFKTGTSCFKIIPQVHSFKGQYHCLLFTDLLQKQASFQVSRLQRGESPHPREREKKENTTFEERRPWKQRLNMCSGACRSNNKRGQYSQQSTQTHIFNDNKWCSAWLLWDYMILLRVSFVSAPSWRPPWSLPLKSSGFHFPSFYWAQTMR